MKVPSAGSVDSKFAMCAAEVSKASQSFEPSSESSPASNPDMNCTNKLDDQSIKRYLVLLILEIGDITNDTHFIILKERKKEIVSYMQCKENPQAVSLDV